MLGEGSPNAVADDAADALPAKHAAHGPDVSERHPRNAASEDLASLWCRTHTNIVRHGGAPCWRGGTLRECPSSALPALLGPFLPLSLGVEKPVGFVPLYAKRYKASDS